jgi:ribosomal protein S18 acetylase RimI-like enzyme
MDVRFRKAKAKDRDWIWDATTETVWHDMPATERAAMEREEWEKHFRGEAEVLLEARVTETWVAEDEAGNRLGYIIMGRTTGMFSPIGFGFIYDIYVEPEHRRKGVGEALLGKAEAYCREKDLRYLRLEASSDNAPAMRLYEKEGFVTERVIMSKDLGA